MIIANRESFEDPAKRKAIEEIVTLLLGVMEARRQVLLSMNVPTGAMERIVGALPALKKPTVSRLHGIDYYSVQTVVHKSDVNTLIPCLKAAGAEDILEIPITKIVR
ncbi:MAG: ATP phosphoribosyltransferase [Methanoregulaceae archaeon PtaU1.Bin222]|nr:MAG: ATP phosphoribosyltransferase [Methanoregulaceae archaeon PtaU1.Bin222]